MAFESFSHYILTRRPGSITSGHEASSGNIRYFNAILDGLFVAAPQQCRDLDYPHPSYDGDWEDTWPSQLAAARQHEDDLRAIDSGQDFIVIVTDGSGRKELEIRASGQSVAFNYAARVCEQEGLGFYPADVRPMGRHHEHEATATPGNHS